MLPHAKVPDELVPDMLAMAGRGASGVEIAAWLKSEHKIEITARGVNARLAQVAGDRADVTKAVVREKLAPIVVSDLDELEAARLRARAIEDKAMDTQKYGLALTAIKEQRQILTTKLTFSGAGTGEAPSLDAREALIAKLAAHLGEKLDE